MSIFFYSGLLPSLFFFFSPILIEQRKQNLHPKVVWLHVLQNSAICNKMDEIKLDEYSGCKVNWFVVLYEYYTKALLTGISLKRCCWNMRVWSDDLFRKLARPRKLCIICLSSGKMDFQDGLNFFGFGEIPFVFQRCPKNNISVCLNCSISLFNCSPFFLVVFRNWIRFALCSWLALPYTNISLAMLVPTRNPIHGDYFFRIHLKLQLFPLEIEIF